MAPLAPPGMSARRAPFSVGMSMTNTTITPRLGTTEEWLELRSRVNPVLVSGYEWPGYLVIEDRISQRIEAVGGEGRTGGHLDMSRWPNGDACYQRWVLFVGVAPSASWGHVSAT